MLEDDLSAPSTLEEIARDFFQDIAYLQHLRTAGHFPRADRLDATGREDWDESLPDVVIALAVAEFAANPMRAKALFAQLKATGAGVGR
jgi:hypothetical protein